jgi:acetolactate decarboxylase
MTRHVRAFGVVIAAAVLYQVWSVSPSNAGSPSCSAGHHDYLDRVVQIAPLERLMQGGFDGLSSVGLVQQSATFGIGTFTGLDGEMIMLDGVVYQAPANGILRVATPGERIPFATLTRFRSEQRFATKARLATYADLQGFLTAAMPDLTEILAIKVHGTVKTIKLRSPRKQVEPYPTLTEALKTQAIFDLTNVSGTFVGFRFPPYIGTMNSAGYHFHFITDDRKIGGHVLEVSTSSIQAAVETVEQYDVSLSQAD